MENIFHQLKSYFSFSCQGDGRPAQRVEEIGENKYSYLQWMSYRRSEKTSPAIA
jgi:hypothetical protein